MPRAPTVEAAATLPRTRPVADPAVFHTAAVPASHSRATAESGDHARNHQDIESESADDQVVNVAGVVRDSSCSTLRTRIPAKRLWSPKMTMAEGNARSMSSVISASTLSTSTWTNAVPPRFTDAPNPLGIVIMATMRPPSSWDRASRTVIGRIEKEPWAALRSLTNSRDSDVRSESMRAVGALLPVNPNSETRTRKVSPWASANKTKSHPRRRCAISIRQLALQLAPRSPAIAHGGKYFHEIRATLANARHNAAP